MSADGRPLRVVHLDTGKDFRGGQQQLLLLARGLRRRAHEQLVVCPEGSSLEELAQAEGFRVFSLPAHDPANAYGILQLREFLRSERFEIFHAHDGRGQTVAWLGSLGRSARRVASRRVTFLPSRIISHRLKYNRTCHAVIAVSKFVQGLLVNSGVGPEKIEIISDGVEVPATVPDAQARAAARGRWNLSEQDFVVGHIGAFTREKAQDVAIEAALLLKSRLPQVRLLLAGEGPLRYSPAILEKMQRAEGRVRLPGFLVNLAEFLSALDLFIMPSRAEGFGSSAALAMAYGLPVVASRVGGLPEIVEDGKTGWLVPPESPQSLADAIFVAARDRARLRQYAQNARERAREFSADIMVERTEALYRRLLAA